MNEEENNKKTNEEFDNQNINIEEEENKQINSIINNNNFYHSIIEKHEKINNDNSDINIDNNTEEDIKEEIIIESSSSNSNILKFNNETSSNKNNLLPLSIKTKDLKNIRKQKLKLNNSFKLSPKNNLITSLNELNYNQKNKVNLSNNLSKENIKNDFLPRICSSQSLKKKPELRKSQKNKKIHSEIPFKKKPKLRKKTVPLCAKTLTPYYIYDRYLGFSRQESGIFHAWLQTKFLRNVYFCQDASGDGGGDGQERRAC